MGKNKVIVDSDFLVALFKPDDFSHRRAVDCANVVKGKGYLFVALNLVVQESTTVISHKMGMADARTFHAGLKTVLDQTIRLHEELEKEAWKLFLQQTKKGTSFIDCANLAAIAQYKLSGILSFDQFYPKSVIIS